MSLSDAEANNERLILIAHGQKRPNPAISAERMMWDLWRDMRAHDEELALTVEDPCFLFMRAQTDKARLNLDGLAGYFKYREQDIGTACVAQIMARPAAFHSADKHDRLCCAIMTFCMGLRVPEDELRLAQPAVSNFAKHLLCIDDIYSYKKELRMQNESMQGGGMIVSAVPMVIDLVQVGPESAKRILWTMCREWELNHHRLVAEVLKELPSKNPDSLFQGDRVSVLWERAMEPRDTPLQSSLS